MCARVCGNTGPGFGLTGRNYMRRDRRVVRFPRFPPFRVRDARVRLLRPPPPTSSVSSAPFGGAAPGSVESCESFLQAVVAWSPVPHEN